VIADAVLSPRQHRAIAALLRVDTQEQAAMDARVGVRTLRRWQDDPVFSAELARQRDRLVGAAALTLARGMHAAARALVQMADGTAPATAARTAAAKAVIEGAVGLVEFSSMERRVSELEKAWALSRSPSFAGRPS
jgi:hypothetical protein